MTPTERRWRDEAWCHEAEAARLREALGEIVATKNSVVHGEEGSSLVLDAESKMRAIAARALTEAAHGVIGNEMLADVAEAMSDTAQERGGDE